jgi:short-subunit dehydrogenase
VVLDACEGVDIGLVVAAAGFGTSGRFAETSLADELDMLEVNCRAVLVLAHHFAPRLQARGRGGIVLLASLVGWNGTPNAAHYAATKAYNQVLAEGLGRELKARGVDVLSVAPGPVRSGFAHRAGMVMGAAETPETVARAALAALGRRTTVVPGRLSKLLTYSLALLPRGVRISILGRVMGSMTAHRSLGAA